MGRLFRTFEDPQTPTQIYTFRGGGIEIQGPLYATPPLCMFTHTVTNQAHPSHSRDFCCIDFEMGVLLCSPEWP